MKGLYFSIILIICAISVYSQSYKQDALKKFEKQDYNGGIELLKRAVKENPNAAELYCDLGHYYHYRAYDSRPLINYNRNYSDSIIAFLDKAISMKPGYREPFRWLDAEYGARAHGALVNRDVKRCKQEYKTAINKGAIPKWMFEYGRNTLSSCDANAILFTNGDLTTNATGCVQIIENYRKDVTIVNIALAERPGYVKLYKYGISNTVTPVKIRFSEDQIMEMRPYKWDTITLNIKIPEQVKQKYKIEKDYFKWDLAPDMTSEGSTYLSPGRAVFAEIIEANAFERPVYFAAGFREETLCGLPPFTTNCGIVKKLVPFITKDTPYEIDNDVIEKVILNKQNLKDFKDVEVHDLPGFSQALMNCYANLWHLANYYNKKGEKDKILTILDLLKGELFSSSLNSDQYYNWINDIYKK
jgi:hypothetical protein